MIVLDTNVVSELMRSDRDRRVEAWARGLTVETAVTAITLGELLAGVRRLPEGARKDRLHSLVRDVTAPYDAQGLVLPFDAAAADQYAEVLQGRRERGLPIATADAQIAAICRAHGAVCSTRNVKDFVHTGVELLNPFE